MNIVPFSIAKILFNLGYKDNTFFKYSRSTGEEIVWTQGTDLDYPAPTYEETVDFLWEKKIAQIYYMSEGNNCKGVIYIPELRKLFTTKRKFSSPSEAIGACFNILSSINNKYNDFLERQKD